MQPCDQHIGKYLQYYLKKKTRDLASKLNQNNDTITPNQLKLKVCKWVGMGWKHIVENQQHLLRSAWKNTQLFENIENQNNNNNNNVDSDYDCEMKDEEDINNSNNNNNNHNNNNDNVNSSLNNAGLPQDYDPNDYFDNITTEIDGYFED